MRKLENMEKYSLGRRRVKILNKIPHSSYHRGQSVEHVAVAYKKVPCNHPSRLQQRGSSSDKLHRHLLGVN